MYRVAIYSSYHGYSFGDYESDKFSTIEEALAWAVQNSYGDKFKIVKVVEYKVVEEIK